MRICDICGDLAIRNCRDCDVDLCDKHSVSKNHKDGCSFARWWND
jgi:hypothetical protein